MLWALGIGLFGGACIVCAVRWFDVRADEHESSDADAFEIIEDDVLG